MHSQGNSIYIHRKLLNIYTSVFSQEQQPDFQAIGEQLSEIRQNILDSNDKTSATFYACYLKLLILHPHSPSALKDLYLPHGFEVMEKADRVEDSAITLNNRSSVETVSGQESDRVGESLSNIADDGAKGISLITCCKNRNANLIKAIPSWIKQSAITEILIVDWDSDTKLEDDLESAGISDPRIRIIRVEGEPRWILSYAFNVGFRMASYRTIVKVDADIVLSDDFFQKNILDDKSFIAGNWRNVDSDQNYVNGFFYTSKHALHLVGGFNEHITTYGWDDDDLYDRLVLSGFARKDVAPDSVYHLPHSDEERADGANFTGGITALEELEKGTRYLIRRNRYITYLMPGWHQKSVLMPFQIEATTARSVTLRRKGYTPSLVPQHVLDTARFYTLLDFTSWEFGQRARELDREKLYQVLERPNSDLSRVDIEVALSDISQLIKGKGHYAILSLDTSAFEQIEQSTSLSSVIRKLRSIGFAPVLSAPVSQFVPSENPALKGLVFIPSWLLQSDLPEVSLHDLSTDQFPPETDIKVKLNATDLAEWRVLPPFIARPRSRLFIDAQHGLGNRLRAIGSAAAIARATDRELVIVWEPDHHCQCAFSDLFEYSGEVIEKSFIEDARSGKAIVYNYMPNEPDTDKGRLIQEAEHDIYARTAFTLNSPHSHWESENRFLKTLLPVAPVRELVNTVRHPNAVSAHVRMETEVGREHNTYDRAENWTKEDHQLIHHWRAKSHFSHFLTKIDQLIAEGLGDTIFLAADLPETYEAFKAQYGNRLAYLPRQLYDRSAQQLHYALADAILLSRSPLLLGSTWSSFSELAMRLAPQSITVKMSGKDF